MTRSVVCMCCGVLLVGVSCVGSACSADEDVVLELELVSDVRINKREQVLRKVRSVVVVVDSPKGLYPPGAERVEGGVEIKDDDGDPSDLELVAVFGVWEDWLSQIRLHRGGLPDVPLELRVRGLPYGGGDTVVAAGGVSDLRFMPDVSEPVSVPFNLVPAELPPRVVEISATCLDHSRTESPDEERYELELRLIFSKAVDPLTLDGKVWIEDELGQREPDVLAFAGPFGVGAEFAYASFRRRTPGAFTLHVESAVADLEGAHLDQDAALDGNQPFQQDQLVECDRHHPDVSCTCPGPEGRFECIDSSCVPSSCNNVVCPAGYVCDPATAFCAVDCRIYGDSSSCLSDRPTCDDATGACVAAAS